MLPRLAGWACILRREGGVARELDFPGAPAREFAATERAAG